MILFNINMIFLIAIMTLLNSIKNSKYKCDSLPITQIYHTSHTVNATIILLLMNQTSKGRKLRRVFWSMAFWPMFKNIADQCLRLCNVVEVKIPCSVFKLQCLHNATDSIFTRWLCSNLSVFPNKSTRNYSFCWLYRYNLWSGHFKIV